MRIGRQGGSQVTSTHVIVLPGGGYAEHAPHEGEPVARWLSGTGVSASVFRYPLKDRKSTRLNSSHLPTSRMPSSA